MCPGDSGGPVITWFPDKQRFFLIGIIHGAFLDCTSALPGIFVQTDEPSVLDFLLNEVFGSTYSKKETVQSSRSYYDDCGNVDVITSSWDGGQIRALDSFKFPKQNQETISEWFMILTFNKNITNLDVWASQDENCMGKVCTFHSTHTGYSFSEAPIFALIKPKYDAWLFIEVQVLYMLRTSSCSESQTTI